MFCHHTHIQVDIAENENDQQERIKKNIRNGFVMMIRILGKLFDDENNDDDYYCYYLLKFINVFL